MSLNQPRVRSMVPSLVSTEPITRHVLVLMSPEEMVTADLARRLREIGAPTTIVESFEEVEQLLSKGGLDVGALLIPTHVSPGTLTEPLETLRAVAPPAGINFISVGKAATKSDCKKLRNAGVELALWSPISEADLRFQINRALFANHSGFGNRGNPRIPTALGCTVTIVDRTKEALIYSLAANGAFLATRRASMTGAQLGLELRLPGGPILTAAKVVYANVPGNLQRPGLPLGMGVHFEPLDRSDEKRMKKYISECIDRLQV